MDNMYIYIHRRLDTGKIFYVGLGSNKRAYITSGRSTRWQAMYRKHGRECCIKFDNLNVSVARLLERALIKLHRTKEDGGCLVNFGPGGDIPYNKGLPAHMQSRFGKKNNKKQRESASINMKNNNPMYRQEVIDRMVASKSGKPWKHTHKRFRNINIYKDGEIVGTFNGPKNISEVLNLNYGSVLKLLNGQRNSLFGYKII